MKPPQHPTPRNVPRIDWPNLTDEALEELRMLVDAELERRWFARRPRSPVDDLYDSGRVPACSRGGLRYLPLSEPWDAAYQPRGTAPRGAG
jgi:hypothetical protein